MSFENLPGIFANKIDGNLQLAAINENPVVLILGTASRGQSETVYNVTSGSLAASDFGRTDGTLIKGMYEALSGGAENLRLMRIGAQSSTLSNIGAFTGTGVTLETVAKDQTAGEDYKLFWEDTTGRMRVWRVSDDVLVYDNNPAYPSAAIDEQEVSVSGTAVVGAGNIGTLLVPITMAEADTVGGAVYVMGDDGILLSRMELFEALFVAYKLLENEDLDVVLPQNVYLDDENLVDKTVAEVAALQVSAPWAVPTTYPTPGTFYDILGYVFAQEYNGKWYFWWDMDRDGIAELYPSVGSAGASKDAFNNTLTGNDFHKVNFGYQLADFCYRQSENSAEVIGMIGMLPPISWSLKDVSNWIGRLPTYTEDSAGNYVISANGTGLMGNMWMAGRLGAGGIPGHIVSGIDGLAYGGFIATDDGWSDGTQLEDRMDHLIDIGKYISVIGAQVVLANQSSPTSYVGTGSSIYGGLVASLPGNSAPTNKVQPGVRLPFRIALNKLDDLAGLGYVMMHRKPKGIVVSDAPTASRPDSDYRRLSTVTIVKATIDAVRSAGEPFIGEPITGARLAALENAINTALVKLQKSEYLQRFEVSLSCTPLQQIQGDCDVDLILVPAFELRQITVHVSLSAQ